MMKKATLAGGCFWCTEAIFKRLKGVHSVTPGYCGGNVENPTYDQVCSGKTGHVEAIQIVFDPQMISYQKLLEIFFKLYDPTTLNRQGNDAGTEYRSVIFYHDQKQHQTAIKVKQTLEKQKVYKNPIVTKIEPFKNFYQAEDYHQNYYENNKSAPLGGEVTASSAYCQIVIDPKIEKLTREFKKETYV